MPDESPEPTDFERMLLHLRNRRGRGGEDLCPCPVCDDHDWDVLGLVTVPNIPRADSPGARSRPMMQVVCNTCFHMQHFLWEPIRRRQFLPEALVALRQQVREIDECFDEQETV